MRRESRKKAIKSRCLPHARGGVSGALQLPRVVAESSPRPWGCFRTCPPCTAFCVVFPTPVGVFPIRSIQIGPRTGLPHARGGVSPLPLRLEAIAVSSPRPWGCFLDELEMLAKEAVFPTPVGVFLSATSLRSPVTCLPHARGGVSIWTLMPVSSSASSPRPWGCFSRPLVKLSKISVFPTPVGVFLRDARRHP